MVHINEGAFAALQLSFFLLYFHLPSLLQHVPGQGPRVRALRAAGTLAADSVRTLS